MERNSLKNSNRDIQNREYRIVISPIARNMIYELADYIAIELCDINAAIKMKNSLIAFIRGMSVLPQRFLYDKNDYYGKKMQYYRKLRNISVEEVRQYMHFSSVQAIYKWENGKCFPSADNLLALAELYGVNSKDLMPKREIDREFYVIIEIYNKEKKVDYWFVRKDI